MNTGESIEVLRNRFHQRMMVIGSLHSVAVLLVLASLYVVNKDDFDSFGAFQLKRLIVNAGLLSLLGGFLNFSRKAYVYLISDKFGRISKDVTDGEAESAVLSRIASRVSGYTLYLTSRPLGACIVGPLIVLAVLAGLTTLVAKPNDAIVSLSQPGMYVVYFFSFVGGYSSSDILDYLSDLGARLIRRIDAKDQ